MQPIQFNELLLCWQQKVPPSQNTTMKPVQTSQAPEEKGMPLKFFTSLHVLDLQRGPSMLTD